MFYNQKPNRTFLQRFAPIYLALILLGITFFAGVRFGVTHGKKESAVALQAPQSAETDANIKIPEALLKNLDFNLFWDVWNLTKQKYLKQPVSDSQLFYGAVSGIVASLQDPYSVFFDPELTKKFTEELNGTFEGIGAEIGIKKDQLVIVAPLPDTPSERAGLRAGDAILKIDNNDTAGIPLDLAVSKIRGKKGTAVTLTIVRNGWDAPKDITVMRETINIKSVTTKELKDNIAYIKLVYFNETAPELFEQTAQEILAKNPKGIILDMRNNPGGLLDVGVTLASYWIPAPQNVVIQESQGGARLPFGAHGRSYFKDIPTVVLVNQGSASASEIVAGALQDYKLARLVGETTFGKGSVQSFEQLRGGSSIKLTIAHWLTPKGRQIDKVGIKPDVEAKITRDDYENDRDPQLAKAVELLK